MHIHAHAHAHVDQQVNVDRDAFGNTALHMAVVHRQPDMYDFLVDFCGADDEVSSGRRGGSVVRDA
jgi:hypothetical protein